jgi:hypothetical protein
MGQCQTTPIKEGIIIDLLSDAIKPLDLILFRGSEPVSDAIALVEKFALGAGDWTHVGIVVTTDLFPIKNGVPNKLYVFESTMSGHLGDGVNDTESNSGKFGAQIRDLNLVVDKYDQNPKSKIAWCPVLPQLNPLLKRSDESDESFMQRQSKIKDTLTKFHDELGHVTYDYNLCNLFSTICCTSCKSCRDTMCCGHSNKMFCSELVTRVYQAVGIIPDNIEAEEVAPQELLGNQSSNSKFLCPVCLPPIGIIRTPKN